MFGPGHQLGPLRQGSGRGYGRCTGLNFNRLERRRVGTAEQGTVLVCGCVKHTHTEGASWRRLCRSPGLAQAHARRWPGPTLIDVGSGAAGQPSPPEPPPGQCCEGRPSQPCCSPFPSPLTDSPLLLSWLPASLPPCLPAGWR